MDQYLSKLNTEQPNRNSKDIDLCSTEEILHIINHEDALVAKAVEKEIPKITIAVDEITKRMKAGGHLFYFGAGTSGRLGVLDASECPPTYGTSPDMVQGYIAGGDKALRISAENCEDDEEEGRLEIIRHKVGSLDAVVGITASGRAPYVIGVAQQAKAAGAYVIGIVTNRPSLLESFTDVCISAEVGNEVITGSTRMKSGTAQKMILNMISTAAMIRLGKVYSNQMVDLRATNEKLKDRAIRIFCDITKADDTVARKYLKEADMETKLAIMMYQSGFDKKQAEKKLEECDGFLRKALEAVGKE